MKFGKCIRYTSSLVWTSSERLPLTMPTGKGSNRPAGSPCASDRRRAETKRREQAVRSGFSERIRID